MSEIVRLRGKEVSPDDMDSVDEVERTMGTLENTILSPGLWFDLKLWVVKARTENLYKGKENDMSEQNEKLWTGTGRDPVVVWRELKQVVTLSFSKENRRIFGPDRSDIYEVQVDAARKMAYDVLKTLGENVVPRDEHTKLRAQLSELIHNMRFGRMEYFRVLKVLLEIMGWPEGADDANQKTL